MFTALLTLATIVFLMFACLVGLLLKAERHEQELEIIKSILSRATADKSEQ